MCSFFVAAGCSVYDPTLVDSPDGEAAGNATSGWMLGTSVGAGGKASTSSATTSGVTGGASGAGASGGSDGGAALGGSGGAGGNTSGTGGASGAGGTTTGAGGRSGAGGQSGNGGASGGGAAGSAQDAGVDTGVRACPTGVLLTGESTTAMHGGSDASDMLYKDGCPQGGPVIGYTGSIDTRAPASVGRIATICGKLTVSSTPNGCQVTVGAGSTLPMRGDVGDSPFTQMCPTNQVVVGMRGRSGLLLDQVGFVCAPLVVSSGASGYTLSIGATTALTPAGGSGGSPYQDACAAGQIARGSNVTIILGIVDAMGLVCGTPSLAGP